jgi:peptidoglycan/xylan/chitin deacetylase (PgdA/CDA1 family)
LGVADLLAQSEQDVRRYVRAAISVMKSKSLAEINALTAQVAAVMQAHALGNHDLGCDRFMTWEQVERLHHSGVVTIGSHAQSHTPIPKLTAQAAATELRESQATIAQRLKFVTPWFAFPNGDFDQQSCELVAAAGYHMAVTTETGFVKSGDDPMRLCRLSIHEKAAPSPARLLCKLAGLF